MSKNPKNIQFNSKELHITYIRSPGPGGQNVNKLSSAVLLRFNILKSNSLTDPIRTRLQHIAKNKISQQGDLIIKANRFRTQERNKQDAIERLQALITLAAIPIKKRKKTLPSPTSVSQRLDKKKRNSKRKALRTKKFSEE